MWQLPRRLRVFLRKTGPRNRLFVAHALPLKDASAHAGITGEQPKEIGQC
jgi:hypothetical protein